jgi:hypothetical protein
VARSPAYHLGSVLNHLSGLQLAPGTRVSIQPLFVPVHVAMRLSSIYLLVLSLGKFLTVIIGVLS